MDAKEYKKLMHKDTPEREIQRAIMEWMNYNGFKVIRINSGQVIKKEEETGENRRILMAPSGTPDILGCHKKTGRMVLVEVKRPGLKPKPLQEITMNDWRESGAFVFVATSIEDVQREIKNI